uniref:Uncharacterized protein n=1 Tax=Anguilla anguilla TaxID=7936 RepID=A0A0E9W5P3_ANGAN
MTNFVLNYLMAMCFISPTVWVMTNINTLPLMEPGSQASR